MWNKIEITIPKSSNKIESFRIEKSDTLDHFKMFLNNLLVGVFERSDLREFIELLDYTNLAEAELLLNGARMGCINLLDKSKMVVDIDNIIHH